MFAIPAALAASLAGPGVDRVEVVVELWNLGTGVRTATAWPSAGTVTWARDSAVRGSCSVTIPDIETLTPETEITGTDRAFGDGSFGSGSFGDYRRRTLTGLLVPLKTQLRIFWRGLPAGSSTWAEVPLGRFTVDSPAFSDGPDDTSVTVTGYDCASDVARAVWDVPFVVPEGTNVATAVAAIIANRLPGTTVSLPTTTATVPQLIYTPGYQGSSGNPWSDATAVALLAGWDLWVDRNGTVTAGAPLDTMTGVPSMTFSGETNVVRMQQTPTAADLVNTVVVYGETSGAVPVVAIVQDTAGPYGTVAMGRILAKEYRASNVRTVEEATTVGTALLHAWGAMDDGVSATTFPLPHLDPGDLVAVSSSVLGLDSDVYRVDRVTVPLDGTASTLSASRRLG